MNYLKTIYKINRRVAWGFPVHSTSCSPGPLRTVRKAFPYTAHRSHI